MHIGISRFHVLSGDCDAVASALAQRPHHVDQVPGFISMWAGRGSADRSEFVVEVRFTDAAAFDAWYRSHGFHASHALIPTGVKLDPARTHLHRLDLLTQ